MYQAGKGNFQNMNNKNIAELKMVGNVYNKNDAATWMITPTVTRSSFLDVNNLVLYEEEPPTETEDTPLIDIRQSFGVNK